MRLRILHPDDEVVEGQQRSTNPLDVRQFVQHAGDRRVRAHENTLIDGLLVRGKPEFPAVAECVGIRARIIIGLCCPIGEGLEIGTGDVMVPLGHRGVIGFVGDHHDEDEGPTIAPGLSRCLHQPCDTRRNSGRRIEAEADAEIVIGMLGGKTRSGVALGGADDRYLGHR